MEIGKLMSISPKLAELNRKRFQEWAARHDEKSSKQAVLAFKGDVYEGLKAWDFGVQEFEFAQKHLRILSGLYGLLPARPHTATSSGNGHGLCKPGGQGSLCVLGRSPQRRTEQRPQGLGLGSFGEFGFSRIFQVSSGDETTSQNPYTRFQRRKKRSV